MCFLYNNVYSRYIIIIYILFLIQFIQWPRLYNEGYFSVSNGNEKYLRNDRENTYQLEEIKHKKIKKAKVFSWFYGILIMLVIDGTFNKTVTSVISKVSNFIITALTKCVKKYCVFTVVPFS